MNIFIKVFENIKWLFFTKRCRYCNVLIDKDQELCDNCRDNLPIIKGEKCFLCGVEKSRCVCRKKKSEYDAVTAPFYYEGGVQNSIKLLKFNNKMFMASILAQDMAETVRNDYKDINFDFICNVPFNISQKLTRNYNQSELLAEALSNELGIPYKRTLVKLYNTETQHNMGTKYRKGNVFGVYDVNERVSVRDKTILLVDDVKTSGATLDECAAILKIRGARSVYCVTATIASKKKDKKKTEVV